MKKLVLMLLLGAAVVMTPAVAQADTVTVGEWLNVSGGFNTGGGSVFNIMESEGNTFGSFCLELGENISGGNNLVRGVTQTAYLGGVAGTGGDPISEATAWLYLQYRAGNPTYAPFAFAVQQAIWVLEGELTSCPAGKCADFVQDAGAGTAADLAKVFVINFGPAPGQTSPEVQDLLTTRVPDGGMTLMLLGGALMGLGALRRKIR